MGGNGEDKLEAVHGELLHNGGEREAKEEGRGFEQGESGTPERAKEEEL